MKSTDVGSMTERVTKKNMGRYDLAKEIANRVPRFSISDSRVMIDVLLEIVMDALLIGKRVELRRFGSFYTHRKAASRGFVPSKGIVVTVDAMWKVQFKMAVSLRKHLMEMLEK